MFSLTTNFLVKAREFLKSGVDGEILVIRLANLL